MNEEQKTQTVKILSGHTSQATAYLVEDYPYGGLRCSIRYWLEHHPKRGTRFMAQTTNPRKGNGWTNKPKASTYSAFGAMFLDEKQHVHWTGPSLYDETAKLKTWRDTYGATLPEPQRKALDSFIERRENYDANQAAQQPAQQPAPEAMKNTSKLDWQTSRIPTTGRIAAISDEGCGYWATLPETMTLQDAADAFGVGYDYNDYKGEISCNATLMVDGKEIESLDFTLDNTPEAAL